MLTAVLAGYVVAGVLPRFGPHEWSSPAAVFRTRADRICLTFDDGPEDDGTPAVLDVLAAAGARATFFVVGHRARRFPHLVRRIVASGHAIGNHGDTHRSLLALPTHAIAREIDDAQHAIEDIIGHSVLLVRPPYGHRDFRFHRVARARRLTPVFWSVNPRDYARKTPLAIADRLKRVRAGDIVLLHDGGGGGRRTAAALASYLTSPRSSDRGEVRFMSLELPSARA